MNIVNIMNFVRGCEPRNPSLDLMEPVVRQNELNKKYGFPNTFLLQYDAVIRPDFAEFFKKEADGNTELGIWIEIVRPLVEKVGIEWRGRPGYDWDWYVNPGFLEAYTPAQREALIDEIMAKFKEVFGYYPKTAASWLIDAHSLEYMSKKYDIKFFGICREQLAVDAYTLWGGPYNQPYYPSKNNMLCPAQTDENKIGTPLVRLLGIEPIRGYWEKRYATSPECGGCATMEPVWKYGMQKDYMEWFFKTYFESENMGIAYTQIGQENSFGWSKMKDGLAMQYELVARYAKEGKIELLKMSETGERFKEAYPDTPVAAITADADGASGDYYRSVWFSNKFYRANIFTDKGQLLFRDIQMFDDRYAERYLTDVCLENDAVYDNLPAADERKWAKSVENPESGVFFDGKYALKSSKRDGDDLKVIFAREDGEKAEILFTEQSIKIKSASDIHWRFGTFDGFKLCGSKVQMVNNGYEYSFEVSGKITAVDGGFDVSGGEIEISFPRA